MNMAVLGDVVVVVQLDAKEFFSLIQSCLTLADFCTPRKSYEPNLSMAVPRNCVSSSK